MLSKNEKINYLKLFLSIKNDSYGDTIKDDLYFYFFDLEKSDFSFLEKLQEKEDIETRIEFLISKIILNEHHEGIENIINDYL
jgi:hypothetical protein